MSSEPGWIFWIDYNGRIRNFTVGAKDEDAAKLVIQANHPDISFLNFVSKQRAPAELVKLLNLTDGKIIEWSMSDTKESMKVAGLDIGSAHDPHRDPNSAPRT